MSTFGMFSSLVVTVDHTSEGSINKLSSGRWLLVYRLDPGDAGNHTGNGGYIACRYSDDNGGTWSNSIVVYSDVYDDRNYTMLEIGSGRLFVYFSRYNNTNSTRIDTNYVYSDDGGVTWSTRYVMWNGLGTYGVPSPSHPIYKDGLYGVPFYFGPSGCALGWTNDGISFTWDVTATSAYQEPAYAVRSNGNVLGVYRHNSWHTQPMYYNEYSGVSWSTPTATQMPGLNYGSTAPFCESNPVTGEVTVFMGDRALESTSANIASSLWAYRYDGSGVFTLLDSVTRPVPSQYMLYGYPTAIRTDNSFYVVVTERTASYTPLPYDEDAWLYTVELVDDIATAVADIQGEVQLLSLPIDIQGQVSPLTLPYDLAGQVDSTYVQSKTLYLTGSDTLSENQGPTTTVDTYSQDYWEPARIRPLLKVMLGGITFQTWTGSYVDIVNSGFMNMTLTTTDYTIPVGGYLRLDLQSSELGILKSIDSATTSTLGFRTLKASSVTVSLFTDDVTPDPIEDTTDFQIYQGAAGGSYNGNSRLTGLVVETVELNPTVQINADTLFDIGGLQNIQANTLFGVEGPVGLEADVDFEVFNRYHLLYMDTGLGVVRTPAACSAVFNYQLNQFTVSWTDCGSESLYTLQVSVSGGAYSHLTLQSGSEGSSYTYSETYSATYTFRVRNTVNGVDSSWTYSSPFTLSFMYGDLQGEVAFSGAIYKCRSLLMGNLNFGVNGGVD